MSDRTPSTTFPAGPLSPSSPAAGSALKESRQLPVSSDHIPQTPTSPPLMSVSDQNNVSNFTSSQASPNQATTHHHHPPHTSSPPSSTPMSTQVSQQATVSTTNSFPTPASSVSGHLANATSAEDADFKALPEGTQESTRNMGDGLDDQTTEHRRTDHDRQPLATASTVAGVRDFATGLTSDPDAMDLDKEPALHSDTRNLGFDSLQKEFTSAFHLCKSCKNSPSLIVVAATAVV